MNPETVCTFVSAVATPIPRHGRFGAAKAIPAFRLLRRVRRVAPFSLGFPSSLPRGVGFVQRQPRYRDVAAARFPRSRNSAVSSPVAVSFVPDWGGPPLPHVRRPGNKGNKGLAERERKKTAKRSKGCRVSATGSMFCYFCPFSGHSFRLSNGLRVTGCG